MLVLVRKSADVQHPGIRGGRFYIDKRGKIRYGEPPEDARILEYGQGRELVQHVTRTIPAKGLLAGRSVRTREEAAAIFRELANRDRERMCAIWLNENHEPIASEVVSIGDVMFTPSHPREVFKNGLKLGAKAVYLAHNHPAGDPKPSQEDRGNARLLGEVGRRIGIRVLGHIVIGADGYCFIDPDTARASKVYVWGPAEQSERQRLPAVEGHYLHESERPQIKDPEHLARLARELVDPHPNERLIMLVLADTSMRLMGVFPIGTMDEALENDRVLTQRALEIAHRCGPTHAMFVGIESSTAPRELSRMFDALSLLTRVTADAGHALMASGFTVRDVQMVSRHQYLSATEAGL